MSPADHGRELAFWSAATGQQLAQVDRYPEYHGAALQGQNLWLLIQRLDYGPDRVHLDIYTDDPAAEIVRLEKLSSQLIQQVHSWWGCATLPDCRSASSREDPER